MWQYISVLAMFSLALPAQTFNYKIKLDKVTNLPEAKYATDPMRNLFKTYPTFNDSLDTFEFSSIVFVEEPEFASYMQTHNYNVIFFSYEALKPARREGEK